MKRIKIGQIGVCHEHAAGKMKALRARPDVFEVVGVVDDRDSVAARFAGQDLKPYEGLAWMSEEELLAYPGLEAVAVETPNADLVPTALRCAARGLAMHMDKPGGMDLPVFSQLLALCEKRDLPFQMGYMFRNNPAMQFSRKLIGEGALGEVFEIQASMSHDYGGDAYQSYLGSFPGGIMFNLGCHLIDQVVAMLGRPTGVTPFLKSLPGWPNEICNHALAVLEYPHAMVTLRAASLEVDGVAQRRLKVCGTKGSVDLCPLERFDGQALTLRLTLRDGFGEYSAGTHMVDCGIQGDRYEDQLVELAQIIRGERENPRAWRHDEWVQSVLLAACGKMSWEDASCTP